MIGYDNVDTFIASGNVIFDAARPPSEGDIEAAIETELGFSTVVYLRTATEVVAVADRAPFGPDVSRYEVSFLRVDPDPAAVNRLMATVPKSDRLEVIGPQVYWWTPLPHGESGHKEGTIVKLLGMPTTRRSIRTVQRIADKYLR